jgi:hypothetical protein
MKVCRKVFYDDNFNQFRWITVNYQRSMWNSVNLMHEQCIGQRKCCDCVRKWGRSWSSWNGMQGGRTTDEHCTVTLNPRGCWHMLASKPVFGGQLAHRSICCVVQFGWAYQIGNRRRQWHSGPLTGHQPHNSEFTCSELICLWPFNSLHTHPHLFLWTLRYIAILLLFHVLF